MCEIFSRENNAALQKREEKAGRLVFKVDSFLLQGNLLHGKIKPYIIS